ncbi:low affinity potassium transport system protein kup-like, partial [Nilaparvata lugens]|uniref:low affinity potassium transport system protein kup-like n=1 Tax=Nilaparvata lugens TaxID=108931 RepID=UPI00193DDB06
MLIVIVSLKYLTYVMRADNAGEGGILTLMVAGRAQHLGAHYRGAGDTGPDRRQLFYGEVVITPAISVMSAIEGWKSPRLRLTLYRAALHSGTDAAVRHSKARHRQRWQAVRSGDAAVVHRVGGAGARSIIFEPEVLQALNPKWALNFFMEIRRYRSSRWGGGAVDHRRRGAVCRWGHFGKFPIRLAGSPWCCHRWCSTTSARARAAEKPGGDQKPVLPAGTRLGADPVLILATLATVIASQAVISGVFSRLARR